MEDFRIEFPEVTQTDMMFGGYQKDWFNKTLAIAENRKDLQKYCDMANKLFFKGGKIPVNKKLDKKYTNKGMRILNSVLRSWEPKHEHKELVCAMILESICK